VDPVLLFIECLTDDMAPMRRVAAWELGRTGDPRALEPLVAALRDEDWECRHYVVMALGWLGDSRAIAPLERLLADGDFGGRDGDGGPVGAEKRAHFREDVVRALRCLRGEIADWHCPD
jgi:HEAT repeat protein